MLQAIRRGTCGCQRRPKAGAAADPNVCPISGQTSATGVCPISGQSTAALAGEEATKGRAAEASLTCSGCSFANEPGSNFCRKCGTTLAAEDEPAERKDLARERDPLLGAASEADAETSAELREQGGALFKKQRFEEALDAYSQALLLTPKDASLWLNRSIVNRQLRNWADGEEDAMVAIEIQPSNAKAHYSRAVCLQQMGDVSKALRSCEAGLSAQQDNKALKQLRVDLRKAQSAREIGAVPKPKKGIQATASQAAMNEGCPVSRMANESKAELADAIDGVYRWQGSTPSQGERETLKTMMTDMFKDKYRELRDQAAAHAATAKAPTDQYEKEQKEGLSLTGGHRPMKRPDHVDVPESFRSPLGVISLDELGVYGIENPERRYLISVYGNCFDVSDRPDKYGPDGPYNSLTGRDITWGLAAGVDQPDYCNKCYDLFKLKDMGKDKIAGVCSWLAWYHTEYGEPVAKLEPFLRESSLPAPPLEEMEDACCVM